MFAVVPARDVENNQHKTETEAEVPAFRVEVQQAVVPILQHLQIPRVWKVMLEEMYAGFVEVYAEVYAEENAEGYVGD